MILLLAERAPSEGPRSTRAVEDTPGLLARERKVSRGSNIVTREKLRGVSWSQLES